MKQPVRYLLRTLVRLLILWVIDAAALFLTAAIVPGVTFSGAGPVIIATSAALLLAIVNLFLRPIILLLALPLGFFVTFTVGFIVNALALLIVARILPDFEIRGLLAAFMGGVVFSFVNTIITGVITVDDEDSFYEGVVERLAARQPFKYEGTSRGLVMLEIDGLSYHHIQKALADGICPTCKR